ncbi:MAG TPA: HIT domain-containing protein [Fimbriimonas sp.]
MPDILWAPWRLAYIEAPETGTEKGSNIFVELPACDDDRKNLILHRGEKAFVLMNAYPYSNGHLLVAPFHATAELGDLDDPTLLEVNQILAKCVRWLRAAFNPDGFNIGINLGRPAGAGIPQHIHWHIVPRWNGDTNFMTTLGGTRVIPQSLEESYDRLRRVVEREG